MNNFDECDVTFILHKYHVLMSFYFNCQQMPSVAKSVLIKCLLMNNSTFNDVEYLNHQVKAENDENTDMDGTNETMLEQKIIRI